MKYLPLLCLSLSAQVLSVTNDLGGTSSTATETTLTPSKVTAGKFGLRCSIAVDDQVFAQPLFVPGLTVGGAVHDVAIVTTMNDSVYAADANTCAILWHVSLGTAWANYFIVFSPDPFNPNTPKMGCFSTPVIDLPNNALYASCAVPRWTLFKLNLLTGATISSVAIAGQVVGIGDTSTSGHPLCGYRGSPDTVSGPNLLFDSTGVLQRPGLKFLNGTVYIVFGGIGDECPYHGWMMTYNASLTQTGIWCSTPNGWGGGIWGSGGVTVDPAGNAYVTTGNGLDYDGVTTYTNSVVKLSSTGAVLGDWFEPANNVAINTVDADTASNRFVLIPGTIYAVSASKSFFVYVIDTTCMGHLQGSSGCTIQTFQTNASATITSSSGSYGATFFNSSLILPLTTGDIYSFAWGGSTFTTTPTFHSTTSFGFPGPAQMSGSCNGTANCILWTVTGASSAYSALQLGTLRAIDPATGSELWNSGSSLGTLTKFASPTVANGKVLVATLSNKVQVFGLLPAASLRGKAALRGTGAIR
jgi:hypothetical protein